MTRRPLRKLLLAPLAVGLAVTLAWSAPAGADPNRAAFADTIDQILTDSRLNGAQAGVMVADAATGEILYQRDQQDRLMPASNSKLLTSAAAMDILGPDYTYATEVRAEGRLRKGTLRGDLYLRGTGDPTLLYEDYQSLAKELSAAGVRTVRGALVADDTRFDDERYHWGWNVDDEQYYYGAPISALSVAPDTDYDAGTVIVTIAPGDRAGDPAKVSVFPDTGFMTIENTAVTGAAGSGRNVPLERKHGEDVLTVSGSIAVDASPTSAWRAVWDPTGHAAATFRTALAEEGIRVTGGDRLGEATPAGARLLASHESMTVAELLNPFMKLSNNGHAEVLIKTMGYETSGSGSWSAGTAAARGALAQWDMDSSMYVLADGSGLTRRNWVSADQFTAMLLAVQEEEWFDTWYQELPIACADERFVGGTLRSRMCGTPAAGNAHAKTGSLTGATALSGYVTDADGRELVFSIVLNYYMGSHPKDIEDQIVIALASHSDSADAPAAEDRRRSSVPASTDDSVHDSEVVKPADLTIPAGTRG
jgi:D-alanyl-D-alanine carboxypeptidase/D-alanyl-D-alanine-endopeptidase (penicillin-binding protein 4)